MPRFVEVGLFFSLGGDLCLMANEDTSFIVGTVFFMIAHVFYVIAFRMGEKVKFVERDYRLMRWASYLVILLLMAHTMHTLWDKFPSKTIFVPYTFLLAIEVMTSL
jgi:uncharacterized membrane protein YhhN